MRRDAHQAVSGLMPFLLILIGAVFLVTAIKNTQGDLGTAIVTDVPPFMKWVLAIVALGGLGYLPGMKTPSRLLLTLVAVVVVLRNYQRMITGFTSIGTPPAGTANVTTPGAQYAANPTNPNVTAGAVSGTSGAVTGTGTQTAGTQSTGFDAFALLQQIEQGFGGSAV